MSAARISGRLVGGGAPCLIVAEAGVNHNGDVALAHRMIDAAADAGADAVKFQNYRTEDFIADRRLTYEYVSEGTAAVESQYDMFKRYELQPDALAGLREHCDARGLIFFSTPTSVAGVEDLVRAGAQLLKNGSDFLGELSLIRAMAQSGLPAVLSTGMATLAEIDDAVRAFRSSGGRDLILLVCTSSYPARPEDVHLRRIATLRDAFGCAVGLSDHTIGIAVPVAAAALGAAMIEKHFTLDRRLPGPDHRFSSDPQELRALTAAVRAAEQSLGTGAIGPRPSEEAARRDYRLSCVAARALAVGDVLKTEDVLFRRPGTGLPPAVLPLLVGRRVGRPVAAGAPLTLEDLG
jgi:N,N'-diacetyllegionaminate synthase